MRARAAAMAATIVIAGVLLGASPHPPSALAPAGYLVLESRSVVLDAGVEVELGTPVDALGGGFSLQAYDGAARAGIVQWRARTGAPVLLLASDGRVRAMSIAFEPRFRTSRGVSVGDPASTLRRAYGGALRDARSAQDELNLPGYVLGPPAEAVTYFDTACTGQVNAIGLALGPEGLRLLASLWEPPDPCGQ